MRQPSHGRPKWGPTSSESSLRRGLPQFTSPATLLARRAPGPHPLPPLRLRLIGPIGFQQFYAIAPTVRAVARAPEMGACFFRGLTETRFPKWRLGSCHGGRGPACAHKGEAIYLSSHYQDGFMMKCFGLCIFELKSYANLVFQHLFAKLFDDLY